jgi:dipeptidyl aminopeptidase/acylaminoacyl peptidase
MPLPSGTRLGPYEILAPLGAGGMGEVYRARDPRLGREVAIKVIVAALAGDRERLARFEQEARAAGALHHPGICTVLDVGSQDGSPFVVMELLEGETLRERLGRGPLPWRKAVEHASAIARALAAAHEKGIVHRDLKPENLFLTRDGRIKVLDFGLAKLVRPEGPALTGHDTLSIALTESRSILGTAGYMSPEQVRGQATDPRTDLFALGAVLYEMLTGERVFRGDSFVEIGNAILNHEPVLDSASGREMPPGLRRVIARCLEKSPEQRFRSAGDLAFHLESLTSSDAGAAPTLPVGAPRRAGPIPVGPLLLVATLIAGLAAGALIARRMADAPGARTVHFPLLPPPGGTFAFDLEEATPFAISPDGASIAFVASDSSGVRRVWLRSLGEGEARNLPGTEGARSLCWSPDGRSLGFFVRRALKRCDLASSGVVSICETPADGIFAGSWGRNGTILMAAIQQHIIYRVPAAGGEPRVVLRPNLAAGQTRCAWPEFLPDGRRFLYVLGHRGFRDSLMLGDLDGISRPIMAIASRAQLAAGGALLYVNDGTLVSRPFDARSGRVGGGPVPVAPGISYFASTGGALFAASRGGTVAYQRASDRCRLAWFDEKGDEIKRVPGAADYLDGLDLTADGRQLLCARRRPGSGSWDTWLLDLARGSESRVTGAAAITEAYPVWLPGERSLVFLSTSEGAAPLLHRRDLASGQVSAVFPAGGFQIAQDVSPDGRSLLYAERRPPGVFSLWLLPLGGGKPRRLTTSTSAENSGQFSPDGRYVAMIADEGEGYELVIVPSTGSGERVRVSTHGAELARWSRDGGRLYFLTPDGHLMAAAVRTRASLQVGEPHALFQLGDRAWKDFVITPDGRFLALVPEVVQAEEPVDVVVGWKAGGGK